MGYDVIEAIKAEAIVTNLRNLLTDFWFIEKLAQLNEFEMDAEQWQYHKLSRSADVTS